MPHFAYPMPTVLVANHTHLDFILVAGKRGRKSAWEQQQIFLQEQERRQMDVLRQLARESAERQERLVGGILDSNARMMAMLLESLQTLQQPAPAPAPLPHFYPGYYPPERS